MDTPSVDTPAPASPQPSPGTTTIPLPASPTLSRTAAATALPPNATKFIHSRPPAADRLRPFDLVRFFSTNGGREAGLRWLQYTLRFILYLRRQRLSSPLFTTLLALVSTLSALRRLVAAIDLFNHLRYSFDPFRALRRDRKGKGKAVDPAYPNGTPSNTSSLLRTDTFLRLTREVLDICSTVADNIFLLSRLHLLPLSIKSSNKADRVADYATLVSALLGLVQVAHSRRGVWDEGRSIRRGVAKLEERLDTFEYWEAGEDKVGEETRLRDKVRRDRRKLKKLRGELNGLWWERLRLTADGVFSTWDVLELDAGSEGIKSAAGLASSCIMVGQAWQEFLPLRRSSRLL